MRYLISRIEDMAYLAIKGASSADTAVDSLIAERGYTYLIPEVLYARPVGRVSFWHSDLPEVRTVFIQRPDTLRGEKAVPACETQILRGWRFFPIKRGVL